MTNSVSVKKHSKYKQWVPQVLRFVDSYTGFILAFAVLIALVVGVKTGMNEPPAFENGSTDSWWVIATNLIHGKGYSLCIPRYFPFCSEQNQTTAAREPVPVFLFSLVALVGGESLWAAAVFELIIYLAILLVTYYLTKEWAGKRVALLAAFIWAVYLPATRLIPQASGDLLAGFAVNFGMFYVMRARKTNNASEWLLAGLWFGIGVMSRSAVLIIVGVVIAGQAIELFMKKENLKNVIYPSLIVGCVVVALMTPWVVRNRIVFGRPIVGSSLVGYNIFRQSYAFRSEDYLRYVGGAEGQEAVNFLLEEQKGQLTGKENEAQMDLIYQREGIKLIQAYPKKYLRASGYRFFSLWFNWKIPEGNGHQTTRLGYAIMIFHALLLLLALKGMQGKNLWRTWPFWASLFLFSLLYMAIESQIRYTIPVIPMLISLSSAGLASILEDIFM